jgi:hypothetical protein
VKEIVRRAVPYIGLAKVFDSLHGTTRRPPSAALPLTLPPTCPHS